MNTFGVAFSPMHGWANRLTEDERWDGMSCGISDYSHHLIPLLVTNRPQRILL